MPPTCSSASVSRLTRSAATFSELESGFVHGAGAGPLVDYLPPVSPMRLGARKPDPELSFFTDRITSPLSPRRWGGGTAGGRHGGACWRHRDRSGGCGLPGRGAVRLRLRHSKHHRRHVRAGARIRAVLGDGHDVGPRTRHAGSGVLEALRRSFLAGRGSAAAYLLSGRRDPAAHVVRRIPDRRPAGRERRAVAVRLLRRCVTVGGAQASGWRGQLRVRRWQPGNSGAG